MAKPAPESTVLYLLELLAEQRTQILDIQAKLALIEAQWPPIVEVDDGTN